MRFDAPLDDVFQSQSAVRVIRATIELPEGFGASAREIARRAGISHPTASKVLGSLATQGLVLIRRTARGDEYEINRDHVLFGELAGLLEIERSLPGELVSFLGAEIAREAPEVERAFLFGSAAWDHAAADSDIDLAVLCAGESGPGVDTGLLRVGDAVRRRFGNRLSVQVKTSVSVRREDLLAGQRLSPMWRRILRDGVPIPIPERRVVTRRASEPQGRRHT